MMESGMAVVLPWIVAGLALLVALFAWVRQGSGVNPADLRDILGRYVDEQRAEAGLQRQALAEVERQLSRRLDQFRLELSERLGGLTRGLGQDQAEARVAQAEALREMARVNAEQLERIRKAVDEQLHVAIERQMQSSFQRVVEQFTAMQKAIGEVTAVTAQIGDLKRLFGNVKTRGGWGEAQLRAILDDVLPPESYDSNFRVGDGGAVVEFALKMPVRGSDAPRLAIDSKFPTEAYERLLDAVDRADGDAERAARRGLESAVRLEARKIAEKYICPPVTVEFAVLYLPTDGLYAEVARVPGLIDEIGRTQRVIVMSPALIPALLRTVHLGYVTLALEERTDAIAHLLGQTRQEMLRMDGVLEKLARNAGAMGNTIEEARRRTRVLGRHLRGLDMPGNGVPQDEIIVTEEI
ncbi:DNA recombination protein RmuC [Brytella acorum]|uniref:DNA recombination protein RmuC homolog n=1 Tax=Brytella acorum TaxID=2959299 RepID=A0AA35V9C2_9PROT|nr:DNA recombination protein RmuC [Brytella acorum]MDF3624834.1 DNA recombination protein RmuC [Brytella acorum]CAI9120137.1 DNA recombination protein RmuC [Brytella acorum]